MCIFLYNFIGGRQMLNVSVISSFWFDIDEIRLCLDQIRFTPAVTMFGCAADISTIFVELILLNIISSQT